MPTTEPITPRLKNDNWDLHQIAERGETPASLIKGTITRDAYADTLAQGLLVHRALDDALARAIERMPELDAVVGETRAFAPWYEADLRFFGRDPGSAEPTPGARRYIEHIDERRDEPLHILGLHYVRLGASNGNRFVARKLREIFGIEHETDGMRALDPFGESQRSVWQSFKDRLDAMDLSDAQRDALFGGTRAAYVRTINLDLDEEMSAEDLLAAHGKTLDRKAFDEGHSVHVGAEA